MLSRLRIRGKLAFLVIIPLLAVVGLTIPVVTERVRQADEAADTASAVRVAGDVGALVQDIQLERMLSVGYLMRTVEKARVEAQAAKVTEHAAQLTADAAGDDPDKQLPEQVVTAIAGLEKLAPMRDGVLTGISAPDKLIAGYGEIVTALLNSLQLERGADVDTEAGRQVVALDASMRTDELITTGAAYLVIAAATKKPEALLPYYTNLSVLQATVDRFGRFASQQQVALYTQVQEDLQKGLGAEFTATPDVNPLQVLAQVPLGTIYTALEGTVGPGRVVSDRIISDVTDQVTDERERALTAGVVVAGLALLIVLLVAFLGLVVARSVVRPLTRLTRSADRVARVTEDELTRVADDEAESPSSIHIDPVDVGAQDEIGDLARAFERVQGTAVGLVERQVASRRNVAQMFGHVGRRTQNLVNRQIALIDRLEGEETDPDRLQHLYRLDHVSSRLRRNAGSLVVLSGATGANEHLNPLPLADVVRLALGEIEDYTRVDVAVPPDLVLAPAVINDMVLVLAELMENATVFSPPHTRVTVSAQAADRGVRMYVTDHGIGMPPEQMDQENARLERRERLDLAPTGVLGLFVVGRLARRHNLRVVLTPTPGGGTTAMIDLGDELLAAAWAVSAGGFGAGGRPAVSSRPHPPAPAIAPPARRTAAALPGPVEYVVADGAPVPGAPGAAPAPQGAPAPVSVGAPATAEGTATFNVAAIDRASRSIASGSSWSAFEPRHSTAPAVDLPTAGRPAPGLPTPARPSDDDQPTTVLPVVRPEPGPRGSQVHSPAPAGSARSLAESFESGVRRGQSQRAGAAGHLGNAARPGNATQPGAGAAPAAEPPGNAAAQTQALPVVGGRNPVPGAAGPPAAPPPVAAPTPPVVPAAVTPPVVPPGGLAAPPLTQPLPVRSPLTRRQPGATLESQPEMARPNPAPTSQRPPDPDEARKLVEQFEAGVVRALGEVRSHYPREEGTRR